VIALCALALSILVAIRGEWTYRRERDDREREGVRRDEELGLLRQQVEGEAEDRVSHRRAELLCRQGDHGGTPSPGIDEYSVLLHNVGRATAHDVRAWIANEAVEPLSNAQSLGGIARDHESPWFKLQLSAEDSRNRSGKLFVRVSWADGTGPHEENLAPLASF